MTVVFGDGKVGTAYVIVWAVIAAALNGTQAPFTTEEVEYVATIR